MGQVNNIQLTINLKRNNRKSDYYGKLYGYTETQNTLSMRGLTKHISDHGTIFTRDIVEGVITKLCECIPELVDQGVPVKLDGIGTFYPTAQNEKGGRAAYISALKQIRIDGTDEHLVAFFIKTAVNRMKSELSQKCKNSLPTMFF